MKGLYLRTLTVLLLLVGTTAVQGEVTIFFEETEYLSALTSMGYLQLHEGFEDDDYWGLARTSITAGTFAAPDVVSRGVTWNGSGGGIHGVTTSEGAAWEGHWGFYSSPHTDLLHGINDGFTVTAAQSMHGFGGYIRGTFGADIMMVIDGNDADPVDLGEICELDPMGEPINCVDRNLGNTPFVAVIDTGGFTQIEVRETEGGVDEAQFLWSDDFTLGFQTLPSARTPGTAWLQAVDGVYGTASNWQHGAPPAETDNAVFHVGSAAPYTVSFSQHELARQMVVGHDNVVFDMGGFEYTLDQSNPTRESIIIGEMSGDDGALLLRNGTLHGVNAVVAHVRGTTGHMTTAEDAVFSVSGQLRIGSGGRGTFEVTSGGQAASGITIVGQLSGDGTLNVSGSGSTLHGGSVIVGHSGVGAMTVSEGGRVTSGHGNIGVGGDAEVVVDGVSSDWTMQIGGSSRGTLRVGQGDTDFVTAATPVRTGSLTIQNRATVSAEESYVGDMRSGRGIVNVLGTDSTWFSNTSGNAFIGHKGNGILNILEGGTVHSGQVLLGRSGVLGEARGVANVDGADSSWNATSLWVGYNFTTSTFSNISDGQLNISNGGVVAASQVNVGARNAAHGYVHVSGLNSRLTASNLLIGPTDAFVFNNEAVVEIGAFAVVDITHNVTLEHGSLQLLEGELRAAEVFINGGSLEGVGSIEANVENSAVVSPGLPTGVMSINGSYTQAMNGALHIELGGLASDQFDALQISAAAELSGTLQLSIIDLGMMYTPQPGDLFEILTAGGGVGGAFQQIDGIAISAQVGLAVSYQQDAVVVHAALLGDANLDSLVDASDFNIWNANKFTTGTSWDTGDFNGDGLTDGSDFNIWNANKFTAAADVRMVPEPVSLLPAVAALLMVLRRPRRRVSLTRGGGC